MADARASRRPAGPFPARRRGPRLRAALRGAALAVACLAAAVPAGATVWENIAASRLTRLRGEARLGWIYDWIQLEGERVSWDNGLLQYYDLGLTGFLWSPRFIKFNADGNYQGRDVGFDEGPVRPMVSTDSFNYSSSVTVLPEHMFPATVYAQRTDTTIDPEFGNPYPVNNTAFGGTMTFRYRPMPVNLGASNTHFVNKNPRYKMDSTTTQTFVNVRHDDAQVAETEAQYQFTRYNDHLRRQDYDAHEGWATNRVWFGTDGRSQNFLRADYVRTYRERAEPRDAVDAADTLLLHHTPSLETNYAYTFRYLREDPAYNASNALRLGVRHRLYKSLLTSANLDGGAIQSVDTNQEYAGVGAGLDYTKTWAPVTLRTGAVSTYRRDFWQSRGTGDGTSRVLAEEHQLFSERPELLLNPDVVADTIEVRDAENQLVYVVDIDYRVLPRGSRTYIARLTSGSIPDGGFVVVDYRFRPPAESEQQSVTWGTHAGMTLAPWRFFSVHGAYRYDEALQWTIAGRSKYFTHDVTAGLDISWMFFTVTAFYNRVMTGDYRFSSYGGSIHLSASPSPVTTLSLSFNDLDLYYDDPYLGVEYKKHYDAEFTASTMLKRMLLLTLDSRYQVEAGGTAPGSLVYSKGVATLRIRGVELSVGASWEIRFGEIHDLEEKRVWATVGRKF